MERFRQLRVEGRFKVRNSNSREVFIIIDPALSLALPNNHLTPMVRTERGALPSPASPSSNR